MAKSDRKKFAIKSTKGTGVIVNFTPSGDVKIKDEKACETYLKKVVDYIEVDGVIAKPKVLKEEAVADGKEAVEDKKVEPKKVADLFGGGK